LKKTYGGWHVVAFLPITGSYHLKSKRELQDYTNKLTQDYNDIITEHHKRLKRNIELFIQLSDTIVLDEEIKNSLRKLLEEKEEKEKQKDKEKEKDKKIKLE